MTKDFAADAPGVADLAAPIEQKSRITIIDTLRGIALLGILLMNIPYFGMPHQLAENLDIRGEYSGPNYHTWWIVTTGFEGTMRGLFSILFGAGAILMISRLEQKKDGLNPADFYYRRLIWLMLFGVVNAFIFLWPGDILYGYALCGLFLFPFRNLRAKHLLLYSLLFLTIATTRRTLERVALLETKQQAEQAIQFEKQNKKVSEELAAAKGEWEQRQEKMNIDNLRKEVEKEKAEMQKGYFSIMSHLKPLNMKFESSKFYNMIFYDIMIFLFLGMALYKMGVLTGKRSTRAYALMLLIGYGCGLSLAYYLNRTAVDLRFNQVLIFEKLPVDLYQFKRIFLCFGHIGTVMLLYKKQVASWLLRVLSKVGQMAFSNYLMQSLICTFIFYGHGLRWFGEFERYQLYLVVAGVWVFQIAFSNIWLNYFRFGPFEWAWRSLTYWRRQPMRKDLPAITEAPSIIVNKAKTEEHPV
ncbi:DUF418 domain-containing protein [Aridibaculum aurantiacum]|uniref:DUF418 domain-containing protein n=1 Tax=Aridibaculum aurantiacum TaxID=2810307 RepID=UPI001A97A2B5|nr:DUF418 domain-containing protein [Aridibaculum aurantiacum]